MCSPKRMAALVFLFESVLLLPSCGGGSHVAMAPPPMLTSNPVPSLASLSPSRATAGGAAFTLTANGTGFVSGSVVHFTGNARMTTFVSSTRLTAAITAADIATAGTPAVTVTNPAPGGGKSNAVTFTITAAVAAISVTFPDSVEFSSIFSSIFTSEAGNKITATVANDPQMLGVTFTLTAGGTGCTPACGQLVTTGPTTAFYAPPTIAPIGPGSTPTITATSVADQTKSASFSFTIQNPVTGQYAFMLTGFDSAGHALAIAGSITADGNGNITDGSLDLDDNQVHTTISGPLMGTYTLGTVLQTMTLTNVTLPNTGINPLYAFTMNAKGQLGNIIEFDASGILASGVIRKQDATAFNLSALAGEFAFELDSNLPVRNSALGRFTIGSHGSISNGLEDRSVTGSGPVFSGQLLGGPLSQPDANGRGTLSLTPMGQSTQNYVTYVVSGGSFFLIQTDPSNVSDELQAGLALRQKVPFTSAASGNGTGVFGLTGLVSTISKPSVAAGVLTISGFTGPGTGGASVIDDVNQGGAVGSNSGLTASGFDLDPGTGRGTLTFAGGSANHFMDSVVFYLVDSGQGFLLDNSAGSNNQALAGALNPQSGGPFNVLSITFALMGLGGGSSSPAIPNVVLEMAPLTGQLSSTADITAVGASPLSNVDLEGTYGGIDMNSGRGIAILPGTLFGSASATVNCVLYLAGPDQFVLIASDAGVFSGVVSFSIYFWLPSPLT